MIFTTMVLIINPHIKYKKEGNKGIRNAVIRRKRLTWYARISGLGNKPIDCKTLYIALSVDCPKSLAHSILSLNTVHTIYMEKKARQKT